MGNEEQAQTPLGGYWGERPPQGVLIVLVYREGSCGCWCTTGEGARAPLCAEHGEAMLPLAGGRLVVSDEGEEGSEDEARLGFAAALGPEADAVRAVLEARREARAAAKIAQGRAALDGEG